MSRKKSRLPLVTLTITTCKRFDLFKQTINSLINCFDIENIDEFLCVDDNSSYIDRQKMEVLYPFFKFIFKNKTKEEKGHANSMNIIKNNVKTPYIFHMEDDFKFFVKKNYIEDMLQILNSNKHIGQCLINKNYSETLSDITILGGEFNTTQSGLRYYIHDYVYNEETRKKWTLRHGHGPSSNYWPHFSFRPSLMKREMIEKVGCFKVDSEHFEQDYAYRYVNNGYISAFLEGIYCIHIGRLTTERDDKTKLNAYILNDESQFVKGENKNSISSISSVKNVDLSEFNIKFKTFVINLDRRPDRWEIFKKNATNSNIDFLKYERFSAIDGLKLKTSDQLQRIFENNDYDMRRGIVGVALSHFQLYIDLIYSDEEAFLIFEDDVDFVEDFPCKLLSVINSFKMIGRKWDVFYLGHHNTLETGYSVSNTNIDKWDVSKSLKESMGGFFGYMISKDAARKFLDFIDVNGMTNAIDTCMQKACNFMDIFYTTPNLIISKCYRPGETVNTFDTDIQFNFDTLSISLEQSVENELNYFRNFKKVDDCDSIIICKKSFEDMIADLDDISENCILYCVDNAVNILKIQYELKSKSKNENIKFYTIGSVIEKAIFITKVHNSKEIKRYFHRLMIDGKYSIKDCL